MSFDDFDDAIDHTYGCLIINRVRLTGYYSGINKHQQRSTMTFTPTTLKDAIREGRNEAIQTVLRESPALANTSDEDGEYPLHHTTTYGNVEAARMLIDAGADVHAREQSRHTPLSWAIVEGTHPVARLLIEKGATYDLWVAAALGVLERIAAPPTGKAGHPAMSLSL